MIEEYIGLLCKEEDIALIKKATGNPYKRAVYLRNRLISKETQSSV